MTFDFCAYKVLVTLVLLAFMALRTIISKRSLLMSNFFNIKLNNYHSTPKKSLSVSAMPT